jgi:hypothetical protein
MLAYVFWHRPAPGVEPETYASAVERFHRNLTSRPPVGFVRSRSFRVAGANWVGGDGGHEDWYVVEDFAALGVLSEAVIGRGHVSAHDAAARQAGEGTGGLYRLIEGSASLDEARVAIWVGRPRGVESPLLAGLLGDGLDGAHAGLWQRQLALGPAPEYCVLAPQAPSGVGPERLGRGWSATLAYYEPA